MKPILLICLVVFGAVSTFACEPVFQRHTKYFRQAKAVFIGKVIDVSQNDISQDSEEREYNPFKIKFLVDKSWKGNQSEITVVSDNGSPPCGNVQFEIGKKYLVYAFGKNLIVTTYVGNRSRPLSRENDYSKKELAELNSFWFRLKANLYIF